MIHNFEANFTTFAANFWGDLGLGQVSLGPQRVKGIKIEKCILGKPKTKFLKK